MAASRKGSYTKGLYEEHVCANGLLPQVYCVMVSFCNALKRTLNRFWSVYLGLGEERYLSEYVIGFLPKVVFKRIKTTAFVYSTHFAFCSLRH